MTGGRPGGAATLLLGLIYPTPQNLHVTTSRNCKHLIQTVMATHGSVRVSSFAYDNYCLQLFASLARPHSHEQAWRSSPERRPEHRLAHLSSGCALKRDEGSSWRRHLGIYVTNAVAPSYGQVSRSFTASDVHEDLD